MIDAIRAFRLTEDSWIFYALERNMYHGPEHERLLSNHPRVKMLYEFSDFERCIVPGVVTTAPRKAQYKTIFTNELRHQAIKIPAEGIVLTQFSSNRKAAWESKVNELFEQLKNQRPLLRNNDAGNNDDTGGYSGKYGPDGKRIAGKVDDLASSALVAVGNTKRLVAGEIPNININDYRDL